CSFVGIALSITISFAAYDLLTISNLWKIFVIALIGTGAEALTYVGLDNSTVPLSVAVGMSTNLEVFDEIGLKTEGKYIKVDKEMRTNIEGIFAIGDIASQYQLIVIAVAQGAIAAHNAFGRIRKPYWYKEEAWPIMDEES
ncbi:unnamed protein product, partial [marine sediment metagenome]